jgi:hypothetical protein
MTRLLLTILIFTTTITWGQVSADFVGEWTSVSSVNKKYGTKNCLADSGAGILTLTFKSDGTYTYQYNLNQPTVYTVGKYSFDKSSMTLKLFQNKLMPDNVALLNLTYKVISVDKTTLKLNWCFCIQSEADKVATDMCLTSFRQTK